MLDRHKASRKKARAGKLCGVGDQVLLYPRQEVHPAGKEQIESRIRARRADQLCAADGARKKQIVGAVLG